MDHLSPGLATRCNPPDMNAKLDLVMHDETNEHFEENILLFAPPTTAESIEAMIAQHELKLERQLEQPRTQVLTKPLHPNYEHDQIMLQMFLTNTTDEYDLLKKSVI